ncbi:MAG TPA: hypothetical protein VJK27_07310 [Terriglobales bacterium]|jgi:hypothetical protein|nr:hypothetical protein [Terriglobales bacterium]
MSISAIQNTFSNPFQLSAANNSYQQQIQQLSQALQSGNLSGAQSDFASLKQAFSQPTSTLGKTPPSPSDSSAVPIHQALNQLGSDLQSGNLSAAQKDVANVEQSLTNAGTIAYSTFHSSSAAGSGNSSGQNAVLQDLNQIGQSLSSNSLAGAQQAYATLQQQLTQFALSGSSLATLSPVSFDA